MKKKGLSPSYMPYYHKNNMGHNKVNLDRGVHKYSIWSIRCVIRSIDMVKWISESLFWCLNILR